MNKEEDIIKKFAEVLINAFGIDTDIVKIYVSNFINSARTDKFKQIIADTEKALDEINDNPDMDVQEKIKSLSVIMLNASVVDADDMKTLTQEEAESYWNVVKVARNKFDGVMRGIQNNINHLKNEMERHKEEDEDLTKLSKEELIERLRRK